MKNKMIKIGFIFGLIILLIGSTSVGSTVICNQNRSHEDVFQSANDDNGVLANCGARLTLEVCCGDQHRYADAWLSNHNFNWWPKFIPFQIIGEIDVKVYPAEPGWKYVGEYQTVIKDALGHVIFDDEDDWHSFDVWKKPDGSSSETISVHDSKSASWDLSGSAGFGVSFWAQCNINYEIFHWEGGGWVSDGPRGAHDTDTGFISHSKNRVINMLFLKFLENHSHMFLILRHLLRL